MPSDKTYRYEGPITFREGASYESSDRLYLSSEEGYAGARVLDELATEIAKALCLTDPFYGGHTGRSTARVRITVEELE